MIVKWHFCDGSIFNFCPNVEDGDKDLVTDLENFMCQNGNNFAREWSEYPVGKKFEEMVKMI